MRCFIDVEVSKEVKNKLIILQNELKKEFTGRYVKLDQLHLTLKFLGEVKDVKKVQEVLSNIKHPKLKLTLNEVGQFDNKIVWVKALGAESLKILIDEALPEFKDDFEIFNPHITLVRMGYTTKLDEKITEYLIDANCEVNSFSLKESTLTPKGPIHEVVQEFELN